MKDCVRSKARGRDFKILGVIGSLENDNGFTFWNPCKKNFHHEMLYRIGKIA